MSDPEIERWIEQNFSGHGRALRTLQEPPIDGEPFMSMEDAKQLLRDGIARFSTPVSTADGAREKLDEALKGIMLRLFCEIQGRPPIDTQLKKIDAEFTRMIDDFRGEPEYLAALSREEALKARVAELETQIAASPDTQGVRQ